MSDGIPDWVIEGNADRAMIAHLTECTLATVNRLEGLSRASKSELKRQRKIAQTGLAYLAGEHVPRKRLTGPWPRVREHLERRELLADPATERERDDG